MIRRNEQGLRLEIRSPDILLNLSEGDSIAVDGVCLTITEKSSETFLVDVMPATISHTTIASLVHGAFVNLERALLATGRINGHIVSGHVDCTGEIIAIRDRGIAHVVTIKSPPAFSKYIVPQGSIALDGISLTVAKILSDGFQVSIIPHTWTHTTICHKHPRSRVNLEYDIVGKYIYQYVQHQQTKDISRELLSEHGFI